MRTILAASYVGRRIGFGTSGEMKEMTMLDFEKVDLSELATALGDHSWTTTWYLDPRTGELWPISEDMGLGEYDLTEKDLEGMHALEPTPSHEGYADMEDFIARVRDPKARDLLSRAIGGRGAFRRFKDTIYEFPELKDAWFAFHDARTGRRAIEWLFGARLISEEVVERELAKRPDPDPPELSGEFDPFEIAREVAAELRELYGERLKSVLLFGSWARGDAHPESDIDLMVVLDEVDSSREERRRMAPILNRRSLEHDTVVSATVVDADELKTSRLPTLVNARREGTVID